MIQAEELQKIRQRLEQKLAQLLGHIGTDQKNQNSRTGQNLDRDDLARNFASREQRFALHDVEQTQLTQVKKALERIDNGTYGTCENCGEPIPPERLEIIPYATLCVRCQQEQDQN